VLEADEYGRAFHEYHPTIAVITNLERDHLDYYGTDAALFEAFVKYADTLEPNGRLIVGTESPCAAAVGERIAATRIDVAIERFGVGDAHATGLEWVAYAVVTDTSGVEFVLEGPGVPPITCRLHVPGDHNVRNALAAAAAASAAGAPIASIVEALGEFRGVRRRFQTHGESAGVLVMDDYAHHPSEIQATIRAARDRYPERRLVVLFQPHTYSRSKYLLEGFAQCFSGVDVLVLTDTYAAREAPEAGLSAVDLATHIKTPGAIYAGSLSEAATQVMEMATPGDVVFTMGAGDVDQAGPLILRGLETP
jgi:UDP-N-acetylmuramate--alanine ligase